MEQQPSSEKCVLLQDNKTLMDETNLRKEKLIGKSTMGVLSVVAISAALVLSSCTYSITMVHTQGEANDVVDETTSNTPNVSPNLTIPASVI